MTGARVRETDQGIQGEFTVRMYDQMQRRFRDKGWIGTRDIIKSGITGGLALEIGPGFLWLNTKPAKMRPGLLSSIRAAYTPGELRELIRKTELKDCEVSSNPIGIRITGMK
ncbi:MAG: hypothetical protein GF417_10880 [Candidatus Latescibacteria bacterium]|nr:hypothetical protein [bacterium]MBD3424930.1 hypothetical protein [Candidatus Latescibacterota bacterium]